MKISKKVKNFIRDIEPRYRFRIAKYAVEDAFYQTTETVKDLVVHSYKAFGSGMEYPRALGSLTAFWFNMPLRDIEPYLDRFSKDGKIDASKFRLTRHKNMVGYHDRYSDQFNDANYSLVLFYEKKPIALIGFNIVGKRTMLVKQIQGVRGKKEELSPIKWERMLPLSKRTRHVSGG